LFTIYNSHFKLCDVRIENPRITSVFIKKSHYLKAYNTIKLLYTQNYKFSDDLFLLNISKLSSLYELFNLYFLIERLDNILLPINYKKNISYFQFSNEISTISYISQDATNVNYIKLYYQPKIYQYNENTGLIVLNYVGADSSHYTPDYILEISHNNSVSYIILDSKYSNLKNIRNVHLQKCIQKYIVDLGVHNQHYKKPNWLVILHPDKNDNSYTTIERMEYFPKIITLNTLPSNSLQLDLLLKDIFL
jgi:hypothetical protein